MYFCHCYTMLPNQTLPISDMCVVLHNSYTHTDINNQSWLSEPQHNHASKSYCKYVACLLTCTTCTVIVGIANQSWPSFSQALAQPQHTSNTELQADTTNQVGLPQDETLCPTSSPFPVRLAYSNFLLLYYCNTVHSSLDSPGFQTYAHPRLSFWNGHWALGTVSHTASKALTILLAFQPTELPHVSWPLSSTHL